MSALSYIIFILVALLACAIGAVGAYFYYRARHREAVGELEALDQDLAEREEELHRLQYQFRNAYPGGLSTVQTEAQSEMQKIREELEQKKNDYNILKQDFDLEIGILKQELDQLREEKSNVEHTRRHLARKETDLEEREAVLRANEEDVTRRSEHLEAEIAERSKRLEDDIAARSQELEDNVAIRVAQVEEDLGERDRHLRALLVAAEEEREELARERADLQKREKQLDTELTELPTDKFTSRQEAILIRRLRQQIKLQRDELEQLQRLYHRTSQELNALSREEAGSPDAVRVDAPPDPRDDVRETSSDENGTGDHGGSFPAYSTLSSFVDHHGQTPIRTELYKLPSSQSSDRTGEHDDLTSLPGMSPRLQEQLHGLGITSFDQIARWSSADVRRVSERLEIDRKTIQDHWIINAQSHLFSRKAD